jgi:chromosome segregation ATPase
MQEHLELVAKGAAGMSPQHSSLYNSLSERMVKAERRITDVESGQDQHRLELAQLREQLAELHVKSTATEAKLTELQVKSTAT